VKSKRGWHPFMVKTPGETPLLQAGLLTRNQLVAAHPHYPLGTIVRVTNLENRRSVSVRIIDRGPSASTRWEGVIIDVSRQAAESLGFKKDGRTKVRTEVLRWGTGRK
jgi:rare lipoprotein A